jgi:hypothetical protein
MGQYLSRCHATRSVHSSSGTTTGPAHNETPGRAFWEACCQRTKKLTGIVRESICWRKVDSHEDGYQVFPE